MVDTNTAFSDYADRITGKSREVQWYATQCAEYWKKYGEEVISLTLPISSFDSQAQYWIGYARAYKANFDKTNAITPENLSEVYQLTATGGWRLFASAQFRFEEAPDNDQWEKLRDITKEVFKGLQSKGEPLGNSAVENYLDLRKKQKLSLSPAVWNPVLAYALEKNDTAVAIKAASLIYDLYLTNTEASYLRGADQKETETFARLLGQTVKRTQASGLSTGNLPTSISWANLKSIATQTELGRGDLYAHCTLDLAGTTTAGKIKTLFKLYNDLPTSPIAQSLMALAMEPANAHWHKIEPESILKFSNTVMEQAQVDDDNEKLLRIFNFAEPIYRQLKSSLRSNCAPATKFEKLAKAATTLMAERLLVDPKGLLQSPESLRFLEVLEKNTQMLGAWEEIDLANRMGRLAHENGAPELATRWARVGVQSLLDEGTTADTDETKLQLEKLSTLVIDLRQTQPTVLTDLLPAVINDAGINTAAKLASKSAHTFLRQATFNLSENLQTHDISELTGLYTQVAKIKLASHNLTVDACDRLMDVLLLPANDGWAASIQTMDYTAAMSQLSLERRDGVKATQTIVAGLRAYQRLGSQVTLVADDQKAKASFETQADTILSRVIQDGRLHNGLVEQISQLDQMGWSPFLPKLEKVKKLATVYTTVATLERHHASEESPTRHPSILNCRDTLSSLWNDDWLRENTTPSGIFQTLGDLSEITRTVVQTTYDNALWKAQEAKLADERIRQQQDETDARAAEADRLLKASPSKPPSFFRRLKHALGIALKTPYHMLPGCAPKPAALTMAATQAQSQALKSSAPSRRQTLPMEFE